MNGTKTAKFSSLIFAVCFIAYTSIYIARMNLSTASPGMIEEGLLDSTKIGMLGSAFSVVFALGRLINGGISDRKPPYIMLTAGFVNPVTAAICLSVIYAAISLINTSFVSIFPIRYKETGNVASISGVMDFATYLGAGIGSLVYGFVIKATNSYAPMFASWVIISAVSVFMLLPMMKRQK